MIIIIDGYNVLKQFFVGFIDEKQRAIFVKEMQRYAHKKGHQIIIVFDGNGPFYTRYEKNKKVQVLYSGSDSTADEAIKDLIDTHALRDILLVSDDRELNDYASDNNIVSIASRDFYTFVQQSIQKSEEKPKDDSIIKANSDENKELDELMEMASAGIYAKEEDVQLPDLTSKGKKKSKTERLLQKKIEKL